LREKRHIAFLSIRILLASLEQIHSCSTSKNAESNSPHVEVSSEVEDSLLQPEGCNTGVQKSKLEARVVLNVHEDGLKVEVRVIINNFVSELFKGVRFRVVLVGINVHIRVEVA